MPQAAGAYGSLLLRGTPHVSSPQTSTIMAGLIIHPKQTQFGPYGHSLTTCLSSLNWWMNLRTVMEGMPFEGLFPSVTLVSDASDLGWGVHINNLNIQGT